MSDLLLTLTTTDLENASKQQLKYLVKRVRDAWGRAIDLRKVTGDVELKQYLQDFIASHVTKNEEIVTEVATDAELENELEVNIEIEIVPDHNPDNDLVYIKADGNYYDILTHNISIIPNPDWLIIRKEANSYLKMNELSKSNFFTLVEPIYPILYDNETPTFNQHARDAINALLRFGTVHGDEINTDWLTGVLKDALFHHAKNRVKEPVMMSDDIYYSLAGLDPTDVKSFNRLNSFIKSTNASCATPKEISDNLRKVYGIDFTNPVEVYQQIRENFWHLQQLCGISALNEKHFAIRDKLFSAHKYEHQLIVDDSDREILKSETVKTAKYFQNLTIDYNLFSEDLDSEECEKLPIDFDLLALAHESDYVRIDSRSMRWAVQSDGSFRGVGEAYPVDPDRIELTFFKWDDEGYDFEPTYQLIAVHRDNKRFPWCND